jgi:hypothetical protein
MKVTPNFKTLSKLQQLDIEVHNSDARTINLYINELQRIHYFEVKYENLPCHFHFPDLTPQQQQHQ